MSELKLCPFCGSKPFRTPRINGDSLVFGIICANCGCESPKGITDKKAREWWNKRSKAQAVPQWISVSERLPENEGTYFCLGHNGTPFVCLLRNKKYEGYVWLRNTGTRRIDGITHWMPLPSAPEQNNEL